MAFKDIKELYMEYSDLVDAGEIDPNEVGVEEWVEDEWSSQCDYAYEQAKAQRRGE